MLGRRIGIMAVAAMMAAVTAPGLAQPAPQVTAHIPAKRKKGLFNGRVSPGAYPRVGGYLRKDRHKNAAQVKRASIKAKNRARNKGAHRV